MTTDDGVRLAGWYVTSTNRAAVVLLHGAGSTRSDVLDEAAVLAGDGFGVLMIDARGHGDSGGRAMDFGWYGDADIAAAADLQASLATVFAGAAVPAGTCGPTVHAVVPLAGRRTAKRTLQVAAPAIGAVERDTVKVACTAAD